MVTSLVLKFYIRKKDYGFGKTCVYVSSIFIDSITTKSHCVTANYIPISSSMLVVAIDHRNTTDVEWKSSVVLGGTILQ